MEKRIPHVGEFILTSFRGSVEIATVKDGLIYLQGSPNQPISISNISLAPQDSPYVWILSNEGV